ncbi:MAG: ABC transporter permease subunit [Planctomycetota bacterium]
MIALIRLELRRQLPFVAFLALFVILSMGYQAFTELPHEQTLAHALVQIESTEGANEEQTLIFGLFALALMLAVFRREFTEGTVEWLDALPVTRVQQFISKWIAALIVMSTVTVVSGSSFLVFDYLGQDSLNPSGASMLFLGLALDTLMLVVMMGYALLLSLAGPLSWLLLLIALISVWTASWISPALGFLEPSEVMGDLDVYSARWHSNPTAIWFHCIASTVCALIAGWRIVVRSVATAGGSGLLAPGSATASLIRGIIWVVVASLLIMTFAGILFLSNMSEAPEREQLQWGVSQQRVDKLLATYHTDQRERAQELLEVAPATRDAVAEFFDTDLDFEIRVDMTGSRRHTGGTTVWKLVKLNLNAYDNLPDLQAVLAHELAHVAINVLSDGKPVARVFHEGVASHVERVLYQRGVAGDQWLAAATIWHWHQIEFEDLVDDGRLGRRWDSNVVYPLGETFFAVATKKYGDEIVQKLLRVVEEDEQLARLQGMPYWQQLFRKAEVPLPGVVNTWQQQLEAMVKRGQYVAEDPPAATTQFDPFWFYVIPEYSAPEGWELVCRARPYASSQDLEHVRLELDDEAWFFSASRDNFPGGRCQYQLGYYRNGVAVWGEWKSANP